MLLSEFLPRYFVNQLDLRPKTIGWYTVTIGKFSTWFLETHHRPVETADLSIAVISEWLSHLIHDEGLAPKTVNSYRSCVCAVWNGSQASGFSVESNSRLIRSCRVPKKIPIAWTLDEFKRLVAAAQSKKGFRRNQWKTRRSDFWTGLYLLLYDTGARLSAALDLRCEDVDLAKKQVFLRAESSKTHSDQVVSISNETAQVLGWLIEQGHTLVFPNGVNRQQLYEEHKRTLQKLGLPFDRYHMFHCIRKTTATQISIQNDVELAAKVLGHTSSRLTQKTYIDARQMPLTSVSNLIPRPLDDDQNNEPRIVKFPRCG